MCMVREEIPMKKLTGLIYISILCSLFSNSVLAQTADDYHPYLSNRFNLEIGAFWPQVDFAARLDGSDPNDEVDFDEIFNFSGSQTTASIDFRWRFAKKWSLWGQYWATDDSGQAVLEEDIEWENIIFREGTNVGAGVSLDIVRAFVGREFNLAPQHELGLGVGLHYMSLGTFMEGEVLINDGTTEFRRATANAEFPLPDIGAWYMYSWSPKWMLQVRGDWLSASIGDYSGSMWDAQVGVNFQAFKNIGFGLYYKGFFLDVDIDKSDWHGNAELNQFGPLLTVSAMW